MYPWPQFQTLMPQVRLRPHVHCTYSVPACSTWTVAATSTVVYTFTADNPLEWVPKRGEGKECPYKSSHVKHLDTSFPLPAQFPPPPLPHPCGTYTRREPSSGMCVSSPIQAFIKHTTNRLSTSSSKINVCVCAHRLLRFAGLVTNTAYRTQTHN